LIVQWVAASFIARVVVVNAQARWARYERPAWTESPLLRWLWRTGRACVRGAYYVGVPYLALVNGLVPLRWYALADLDASTRGAQLALSLTAGFFLLGACLIWLHKELVLARKSNAVFPLATDRAQLSQPWGVSFIVWETLCLQAHWLFYRAGVIVWLNDVIMGTLGGALLVSMEWLLDGRVLQTMRQPERYVEFVVWLLWLSLNSVLFVYTSNWWWMVLAHGVVWLGWLWLMAYWYRPLALRATQADEV
jgi:hypothetical protein